jgi:hypothetical protein
MLTVEQAAKINGQKILTVREFGQQFKSLGYKLDRTMDCQGLSRYMTGEHAGESYPVITTSVKEIDTGMSAFHYQARRDDNFRAMQKLRGEICAITKNCLLEV